MRTRQNLYKRAIPKGNEIRPLWHVGEGCSVFAGPLTYNAPHSHSTSIYLAGLYEPFRLRLSGTRWIVCRAAVVPAGVTYELDVQGYPLAVCYLEPNIAGVEALVPLLRSYMEVGGALVGSSGETRLIRGLFEDPAGLDWADEALNDLITFSKVRARRNIDLRISHVVQTMYDQPNEKNCLAQLAQDVGLSRSRFQHVFTKEMGVPFRRYRAWHRLRAAIRHVIAGDNFTQAAHAVGYYDQAHFGRHFRQTFGAPPGKSLSQARKA